MYLGIFVQADISRFLNQTVAHTAALSRIASSITNPNRKWRRLRMLGENVIYMVNKKLCDVVRYK